MSEIEVIPERRPIAGLGDTLSYLQAFALELLPGRVMTRDNYHSMKADNVCSEPFPFGIEPAALEAIAPSYLGSDSPRARYRLYRNRVRRPKSRRPNFGAAGAPKSNRARRRASGR